MISLRQIQNYNIIYDFISNCISAVNLNKLEESHRN